MEKPTEEQRAKQRKLREQLRADFIEAFELEPDKGRLASRFFSRLGGTQLAPRSRIFDHTEFFRHGENVVFASQPYGMEHEELEQWVLQTGAAYAIADEWANYFPGKANLFVVEFTPQGKAEVDKALRQLS